MMLAMVMMLMITACGDDNDSNEPVDVKKAVGTWYCISSVDKSGNYSVESLFVGQQVTVKENGTYTSTSTSFGTSGTYVVSGSNIIVTTNSNRRFVVRVTFPGNTMKWEGSGEGVSFTYVFSRM